MLVISFKTITMDYHQDDSRINSLFSDNIDKIVGDVANVNYNKYFLDMLDNFIPARDVFCDNIVLMKFLNYNEYNILAASNFIRSFFIDNGFKYFNISFLVSRMHEFSNKFYKSIQNEYSKKFNNTSYIPGYALFRISLSGEQLFDVLNKLRLHEEQLKNNFIIVNDIDITLDCAGNINRNDILEFLLSKNINRYDIINNVNKVGKNCISWRMITGNNTLIVCKIYNKLVQMLESHEVKKYIGSRISELVANNSELFTNALEFCKNYGITRIEIKIPYNSVYQYESYVTLMNDLLLFMQGCKIYKTSFESQWKALVDKINKNNVLAIYITNRKIFAYCHWYNSLTSKKQGCIKNINKKEIPTLLTNYSFNTGYIRYLEVIDNGLTYTITSTSKYKRIKHGITLVPGPKNSLYPKRKDISSKNLCSFANMGLIKYKGINLEWPLKSEKLAELEEIVDNDKCIKHILIVNNKEYQVAHKSLLRNTIYKVNALRYGKYRNKNVVFVVLLDQNTDNLIKTKFGENVIKLFSNIDTSVMFYIKTGNFIYNKSNNLYDIEVFLV